MSAGMEQYVRDELPRMLAYPIELLELIDGLEADEGPLEDTGVFFLYTSGAQVDHYDPLTSNEKVYPVIALDRRMPQLASTTMAQLARDHSEALAEKSAQERQQLEGAARADAQLSGAFNAMQQPAPSPQDLVLCSTCVLVFPVKRRIRVKVAACLQKTGFRYLKNWLNVPADQRESQSPLVLLYDEAADRVTAKFAEKDEGSSGPRAYC
jgi:hypothetical protein